MTIDAAKVIVFSDLDGTLIDEKYSFSGAKKTVEQLLTQNAALVLCSSKTRAEIEYYRAALSIGDPFISENGGGVFVSKKYFKQISGFSKIQGDYYVFELGIPYNELRQKLVSAITKAGCQILGFGDMSTEMVSEVTGLELGFADLAKRREYDEPFQVLKCPKSQVFEIIKREGLLVVEGDRFCHATGRHSKGDAVNVLKRLYMQNFKRTITFGVGNSTNDLSMLEVVDFPFFREKNQSIQTLWQQVLEKIRQVAG